MPWQTRTPGSNALDRLKGKSAIITGAGRGIGREYALALAREGANVVVNDYGGGADGRGLSQGPADDVVREIQAIGAKAIPSYADVASFDDAQKTVQSCVDAFGTVDILITNAGMERRGQIWEISEDDWDTVHRIHAKGTFNYVRHVTPIMVAKKSGSIINVTSGAAWGGTLRIGPYAAAKGAIHSLMLVISNELQPYNVNVNCLSPGFTATRIVDDYIADLKESTETSDARVREIMAAAQPPANMAPMAVFLASDEGHGITGKTFQVAGDHITVVGAQAGTQHYAKAGGWSVDDVFASFPRSV